MGVIGLWNLIEDSGTKVDIETLRFKVLAIDLSIWINQSIKGFRDRNGKAVENAHILGLFHRVCKLLFYNIKPIFVFDGDCPTLKSRTLAKRQEKIRKDLSRSKNISMNVLEKYISSQLAGDDQSTALLTSTKNKLRIAEKSLLSELLLPPKYESRHADIYQQFVELNQEFSNCLSDTDSDDHTEVESKCKQIVEEPDDASYHVPDSQHIRDIDFNSAHFKSLPATTRYEILLEIRESFKGRKNPFPETLPSDSNVFSEYQMKKLLKKRNLQAEIDKLIDELNGLNNDDNLELMRHSEHINSLLLTDPALQKIFSGRLASDETTRFLHLKTSYIREKSAEASNTDETNNSSQADKEDQLINSKNFAYDLPNSLNDCENKFKNDLCRIECLSQSSISTISTKSEVKQTQLKQVTEHLDRNVQKMIMPEANNNTEVDLSDSDSTSDSEDFVEVAPLESSQDVSVDALDLFEGSLNLPYNTDYSFNICIQDDEQKSKESKVSTDNVLTTTIEISKDSIVDNLSQEEIFAPVPSSVSDVSIDNSNRLRNSHNDLKIESLHEKATEILNVENEMDSDKPQTPKSIINEATAIASTSFALSPVKEPISVEEMIEKVKESNKIARQAATVNQQIIDDCQELLRLFGLPWVVAPAEAEAQCAALEELGLCDGSITDDSDIFLFGGKRVFRHFFTDSKLITQFQVDDLKKFYGLDRSKLICLGMLCGTDYTLGIDGIGPVIGMELLSEFHGEGMQPLSKFASWYRTKLHSPDKSEKPENSIRAKLLKFVVPPSFPNRVIFDAYQNANVDSSLEPFSWSSPQLSELRKFALLRFGWNEAKTDAILLPVLKNLNNKQVQTRIEFFFPHSSKNSAVPEKLRIKRSKRLNEAIRRNLESSNVLPCTERSDTPPKKRTKRKGKAPAKKAQASKAKNELVLSEESSSESD